MAAKEAPKVFSGMVRALEQGFDNIVVREIGEVFEFKGVLGEWMEPVDGKAEKAAAPVKAKESKDPPKSGGKEAI